MKVGFFYTSVKGNFVSALIRRITGGKYSHVGVYFLNHIAANDAYFESHWGRWPGNGKSGVRGPLSLAKLMDWGEADSRNLLHIQAPLPVTVDEAIDMFVALQYATRNIHYAKLQLLKNWVRARLGLMWYFGHGSSRHWTCSETALQVLPARLWPHYGIPDIIADGIMPSGINGVYEATEALLGREV